MRGVLIACIASLATGAAHGQTAIRLDDSGSPRQRVMVAPQWAYPDADDSAEQLNALRAELPAFEVRLNTRAYVNRDAEIYLRLPFTIPGLRSAEGLRLTWQGRGRFNSGSIRPGERALLFRGRIAEPVLSEVIDVRLWLDGRYLDGSFQFDPLFELEPAR